MITHVSRLDIFFTKHLLFSSPNMIAIMHAWRLPAAARRLVFLLFTVTSSIHHCASGAFKLHKFHITYITTYFIAFATPSARCFWFRWMCVAALANIYNCWPTLQATAGHSKHSLSCFLRFYAHSSCLFTYIQTYGLLHTLLCMSTDILSLVCID